MSEIMGLVSIAAIGFAIGFITAVVAAGAVAIIRRVAA